MIWQHPFKAFKQLSLFLFLFCKYIPTRKVSFDMSVSFTFFWKNKLTIEWIQFLTLYLFHSYGYSRSSICKTSSIYLLITLSVQLFVSFPFFSVVEIFFFAFIVRCWFACLISECV
jgi:hypothetical protein